jgi:hypothetical protein
MTDQSVATEQASEAPALPAGQAETLRGMADDLIAKGVPADRVWEALKADGGTPPEDATKAPAPDPRLSEEAAEIDAAFPAAREIEFQIPELAMPGQPAGAPELATADKAFRGWLAEGRFTRESGNFVAAEVHKHAERFLALPEHQRTTERTLGAIAARTRLERLYGDQAPEKIRMAHQLVDEIEKRKPGLKAFLEASGAGNSPELISTLATQAERLARRWKPA